MRYRSLRHLLIVTAIMSVLSFQKIPMAMAENIAFSCGGGGTYIVDMPAGTLTRHSDCRGNVVIDPSVKSISPGAFRSAWNITSVSIPESVSEIPDSAFSFSGLSAVNLPVNLTKIGRSAFASTGLVSLNLPNKLVSIGDNAFDFTKLRDITLPNSLEEIGNYAFWHAENLKSVKFGSGLKKIGTSAFSSTVLTVVDVPDTVQIGANAFGNINTLTKIIYCGPAAGLPTSPTCPPDRKAIVDKAAAEKAAAEKAAAEKAAAEKAAAEKAAAAKALSDKVAAERRNADEVARVESITFSIKCIKGKGKSRVVKTVTGTEPSCPKGSKMEFSDRLTYVAYVGCKLYQRDSKFLGSVKLEDNYSSLTFATLGKYSILGPSIPNWNDYKCALDKLKTPSFVRNQIDTTRAIDGRVSATWGNVSATWTYHPDNGLNITFYMNQ